MPDVSRWLHFCTDWFTFPTIIEVISQRPESAHLSRDQSVNSRHRSADFKVRNIRETHVNWVSNVPNSCASPGDIYHKGCFSGAFAKLRKATISFVMYVCPPVCPQGASRPPLDGMSFKRVILEGF